MTFDILRIQVVNGFIIDLFEKSADYIFVVVGSKRNDPRRQFPRPSPSKYIVYIRVTFLFSIRRS